MNKYLQIFIFVPLWGMHYDRLEDDFTLIQDTDFESCIKKQTLKPWPRSIKGGLKHGTITAAALSSDGTLLVMGRGSHKGDLIKIYQKKENEWNNTARMHRCIDREEIIDLNMSSNNKHLVGIVKGVSSHYIALWDLMIEQCIRRIDMPMQSLTRAFFSNPHNVVVSVKHGDSLVFNNNKNALRFDRKCSLSDEWLVEYNGATDGEQIKNAYQWIDEWKNTHGMQDNEQSVSVDLSGQAIIVGDRYGILTITTFDAQQRLNTISALVKSRVTFADVNVCYTIYKHKQQWDDAVCQSVRDLLCQIKEQPFGEPVTIKVLDKMPIDILKISKHNWGIVGSSKHKIVEVIDFSFPPKKLCSLIDPKEFQSKKDPLKVSVDHNFDTVVIACGLKVHIFDVALLHAMIQRNRQ